MRKREQLLWDAMKRNLSSALWLQRIENLVGDGMPDVYVGRSGCWVELKAPSRIPVRPDTRLLGDEGLRISQVNWLLKFNAEARGFAYILIRTIDGELLFIESGATKDLNEMSLAELRRISVASSWREIERLLS